MLSVRAHMAITIAAGTYRYAAAREADAHQRLSMPPVRFHAYVAALLDDPAAERERPMEVRRLRRLRDARRQARTSRRAG